MYLGRRPRRGSPRLTALLLLLILLVILVWHYLSTHPPQWARPFAPPPTPTRTVQFYTAEAEAYFQQGQLNEAIADYEQVVTIAPASASAYQRLAELLILGERTIEAAYYAKQAVLLQPTHAKAMATLCRALDWEGEYGAALEACECAIEMDDRSAEAYAYLSEVYADLGNWGAANKYARQALDLNYQSADTHRNQGYAYEVQGKYRQAVQFYENAITLQPRLVPLYISAGRMYRSINKFNEAIDRLERATRYDPSNPVGYAELGFTYYVAGQHNRALDFLQRATKVDPGYAAAWGHLGIVNYALQQYEKTVTFLEQGIKLKEKEYLRQVRRIVILGQATDQAVSGSTVELLRAEFFPSYRRNADVLTATLTLLPDTVEPEYGLEAGCGQLIAADIRRELGGNVPALSAEGRPPATETLEASPVATQVTGIATLDINSGRLDLRLNNLPQPAGMPYEVQLRMWQDKTLSLGYVQPDAQGNVTYQYTFDFGEILPAPVEYYYTLGFAYVHLGQCEKGTPWLQMALDKDSSPGNPAWQGLAECEKQVQSAQ